MIADHARALWHLSSDKSEIRPVQLPEGEWLPVRTQHSLISIGTERLIASGRVPVALSEEMRVPYQEGELDLPVKYGYSLTGVIDLPGHQAHGQLVHLLHPHQTVAWVHPEDVFPIPEGIPARRATLASNLETAITATWDGGVGIGDRVLVVGFGLIGSLVAEVIKRIPGTTVFVAETRKDRLEIAMSYGFAPYQGQPGICDVAFHTSTNQAGLQAAIHSVGTEGEIIELSWYGDREIQVQLGGTFHSQRKSIRSSQVSQISPQRSPRWDYRRRKEVVFNLLKDSAFDRYLTHSVHFEDLPEFFQALREKAPEGIGWTVDYSSR